MRYLGVPLVSTSLRSSDCTILIERIISRAKSWSSRFLSYTGRIQLIKSVLFSIQVYWSSLFILPKKVIRKVESTLRSFLWKGSELVSTGAKVAWDRVCLPIEEGVWGLNTWSTGIGLLSLSICGFSVRVRSPLGLLGFTLTF